MKKTVHLFSLCFLILFVVNTVSAGNETATIDSKFQITLPSDKPLSDIYTIDISQLTFKNAQMAGDFFRGYTDAGFSFTVNYDAKNVVLSFHPDENMKSWTVADWNKYFQVRAMKMVAYYNALQNQ